jgi:hypothetical protein
LWAVSVKAGEETAPSPDCLGEALGLVEFTRADLGYRPKGYWSRFPNPDYIPHKLPFFDDLFAEPLRTYDFTKTMAMAARDYLKPEALAKEKEGLYKLVYYLGVDRKLVGFRGYSANLNPPWAEQQPLRGAFRQLYAVLGAELEHVTFGEVADWPNPQAELRGQIEQLDPRLQHILAELVLNLAEAYRWRQTALRHVDPADAQAVFDLRTLGETRSEGRLYFPEVDDLAESLDELSLYYAAQKVVQAADHARQELRGLLAEQPVWEGVSLNFGTPLGRVVLAGTGADRHEYDDVALVIDLGGDDEYLGPIGGTTGLDRPFAVVIDCGGDDTYLNRRADLPSQGAGVLGAGVLLDLAGNDHYEATSYAQGLGVFGLGLLFDESGDDRYRLELSGQGAGYFGIGVQLDAQGTDTYYLYGDGQGFGGPGGVGVLADYRGDDHYVAEALAEKAGRPDYHSENRIAINNAQGVGSGRRGDGSDGHDWAGGLGALLDLEGNDVYESGNWSLGTGYWFGTGLLYDGAGDDLYRSVYFTQASGAHFCLGALMDEGGNDRHVLYDTSGAGLAFGWDFANALLLDRSGDDSYEAKIISLGLAQIRSNALFFDLGGHDTYTLGAGQPGMGAATFMESYRTPGYQYGPYSFYANSFGLLLDLGGTDRYLDWNVQTDERPPSARWGENRTWLNPARDSEQWGYRNFGVGMDVETGVVPDFEWPLP